MSEVAHGIGQSNTGPSGPQGSGVLLEAWRAPKEHTPLPIPRFPLPFYRDSLFLQGPERLAEYELGVGGRAGS